MVQPILRKTHYSISSLINTEDTMKLYGTTTSPYARIARVVVFEKHLQKFSWFSSRFENFCKNSFLNIVQDQKCSFSSNTCIFFRDIAKWLAQWVYSRKMLPGTGYKISVRIFLAMFMTSGNLTKFLTQNANRELPK